MVVAALAEAWIWIYASRGRRLVDRDLAPRVIRAFTLRALLSTW